MTGRPPDEPGLWGRLRAHLLNRVTWTGLLYLLLKFLLATATWSVMIALLAATAGLIAAPFILAFTDWGFMWINVGDRWWRLDDMWAAIGMAVGGVLAAFVSLHVINLMAWASGRFAAVMLGGEQLPAQALAQTPPQPTAPQEASALAPQQVASTGPEPTSGPAPPEQAPTTPTEPWGPAVPRPLGDGTPGEADEQSRGSS